MSLGLQAGIHYCKGIACENAPCKTITNNRCHTTFYKSPCTQPSALYPTWHNMRMALPSGGSRAQIWALQHCFRLLTKG